MSVRLLHITDIHFGPPHRAELDAALGAFTAREKFDAVVVSGDLTQRATEAQFKAAHAFLKSLSVPQVVVPGNHDVPLWAAHERFFTPFARYRRHLADELEPQLKLPGAWICGINTAKGWTAKNGVFRAASLERCRAFFADAPAETLRVVVAHHHLLPAPGPLYDPVAERSRDAAHALAAAQVDLVAAGHMHYAFVGHTRDYYPSLAHDTLVAHAGTSMSTRGRGAEKGLNSVNVISFDGAQIEVEHLRYVGGARLFAKSAGYAFPRAVLRGTA